MRNYMRLLLVVVVLLVPLAIDTGAQLTSPITFKTTFAFTAGNTKFPAGAYKVRPEQSRQGLSKSTAPRRCARRILEVRAGPKEKPSKGDVIFQRYGDTYVLKTLWVAGSGVTLVETYAEKATKAKGGTPTEHPVTATPKGKASRQPAVSGPTFAQAANESVSYGWQATRSFRP